MPRRVEDIVKSDRRTIKEVEPKRARGRSVSDSETETVSRRSAREEAAEEKKATREIPIHKIRAAQKEKEEDTPKKSEPRRTRKKSSSNGKIWLFSAIGIVLIIIIAGYIASVHYSRATFTIVPVTIPVHVDGQTIVATGTSTPGYLKYTTGKFTASASSTVQAIDGPLISTKSTGSVTIYNKYSSQPQRLIAGTRFTNETGLIYRLQNSIVIPGSATSSGEVKAGSIVTTLVADQAGAQYTVSKNGPGNELKIISYQGGPRYDTIYAVVKTDIAGGYLGRKKTVNPSTLATTTKQLQDLLASALRDRAKSSIPEGYVMYDNAYSVSYNPAVVGTAANGYASISVTAMFYPVLFKETDLVGKLAGPQKMAMLGNGDFTTSGVQNLKFTITNPTTFNPAKGNALIAKLSGDVTITGTIPVSDLRHKLAGLPLSKTKDVISSYNSVIDVPKSSGELFPSWATAVPKDESRIEIKVED